MRIVVATDSFKDCLPAAQVCQIIKRGIGVVCPEAEVLLYPLADGGEGTVEALLAVRSGQWVEQRVTGPLPGTQVEAGFLWFAETRTALVEMAKASGLEHLKPEQRNPLKTTTYGTGELMAAARAQGAEKILLAVGGSATVDLGMGCAAALGWQFLDQKGEVLEPVGGNLLKVQEIIAPNTPWDVPVEVLCDVTNPLMGIEGAAKVFGPQKGASFADVVLLEVGLTHLVRRLVETLEVDVAEMPGGGAAGGLAAGAVAFLQARLVSGFDVVLEETGLLATLRGADWLITGEGSLDTQSLEGKVVSGLLKQCSVLEVPVAVFAGRVELDEAQWRQAGLCTAQAISPKDMETPDALAQAPQLLLAAATRWAQTHIVCA